LNYTLSTISVKREELLLRDSIHKIWKVADNYKTRGDSISGLISSGNKTIDSLKKIVLDLNKKVEQSQEKVAELQKASEVQKVEEKPLPPPVEYTEEQVTGYSKAYESMDPEVAAKHMELMHEDDALEILMNLQPKAAGRILDKMEPKKAAKLWLNLNSKRQR
jgi:flagellar motility protein MotE (MotC chaperone)